MSFMDQKFGHNRDSGTVEDFISHYQAEMQKNIAKIRQCINDLRENPDDELVVQDIQKIGGAISDLAMVYGYEGVEVIGLHIVESLKKYTSNDNVDEFLSCLDEAARGIEEAMLLTDKRKEKDLIRELSENLNSMNFDDEDEANNPLKSEDILFDIREDEKLISLLTDTDGQAVEITHDEDKNDNDHTELIDANSILDDHFDKMDFDIPVKNDKQDNEIEDDILEIDFKKPLSNTTEEKEGVLQKIAGFLGLRKKSRLFFQD